MSDYIVLIKQVPDVTRISDNVFDKDTGNLKRSQLPAVINQLDCQALGFAKAMRDSQACSGNAGKIIALSMGPASAQDVLRYSLARGAEEAVLLSDSKLGGSDTWATAKGLSCGIKKIVRDILKDSDDYYIISGMQSQDGDTAQVPAQLASALDTSFIGYSTGFSYDGQSFSFNVIDNYGGAVVRPAKEPAIVTVASFDIPFATFSLSRFALQKDIIEWDAEDICAMDVGVKGSKTRVVKVFPPAPSSRKGVRIDSLDELAKVIHRSAKKEHLDCEGVSQEEIYEIPSKRKSDIDRGFEYYKKDAETFQEAQRFLKKMNVTCLDQIDDEVKAKLEKHFYQNSLSCPMTRLLNAYSFRETSYHGDIWVVVEYSDNKEIIEASLELIGEARRLADSLDVKVAAVLCGYEINSLPKELIAAGADIVYLAQHELLKEYEPGLYAKAISEVINNNPVQAVFYSATPRGRILAPLIAYKLNCGLTADCTKFEVKDDSIHGRIGIIYQTRPALGGNIMATIITKDSSMQMATVRPGVMKALRKNYDRQGNVVSVELELCEQNRLVKFLSRESSVVDKALGSADVVVSGGRGLAKKENYEQLLKTLCKAIEIATGIKAETGASRVAVDLGYAAHSRQVGQTGTTISPKLYIAVGISGAVQHMIGVSNAQTIIAINNDQDAKIINQCDYYYIGNALEVLPLLTERLAKYNESES